MLTAQGPFISMKTGAAEWAISVVAGLLLYGVLAVSLVQGFARWPYEGDTARLRPAPASLRPAVLGEAFLSVEEATPAAALTGTPAAAPPERTRMGYLLPFEVVSVHLLIVLIGAAYLARAKRRRGVAA
jgi:NADH-quinone oxidoreductase subunit J